MSDLPDGLVDNVIAELIERGVTYVDCRFDDPADAAHAREAIRDVIEALFALRLPRGDA